ncbi:hypothetical protein [Rhodovulum marinum]|uniref:Uncharacterized protein n=1 Tax=Rhodovulum marinum TaxID=320662 RepID=A0A4R2QB94_9RHOB|nr:hypothetical protein [Rhodovulum marinum]TCP44181.1 hypothetical protein EV662_101271 [Rhodovulum marinum]
MADTIRYAVQVTLPATLPEGVKPQLHVFDATGKFLASAAVPENGKVRIELPKALIGTAIRLLVAPAGEQAPKLRELRRAKAVERTVPFDPETKVVVDIPDLIAPDWVLCACTIRGRVVKAVAQPTGVSVDYPVCNARVHICEVDKFPRIILRLPDHIIERIREELLVEPPFPPDPIGPVIRKRLPELAEPPGPGPDPIRRVPVARQPIGRAPGAVLPVPVPGPRPRADGTRAAGVSEARAPTADLKAAAPMAMTGLARAGSPAEMRKALISLAEIYPWWCWFTWLDPFWRWEVDCLWEAVTDETGAFSKTVIYPCDDRPDIYLWVEQFIAGSWKTIHARGPRCDTHWNYACGTEITIHVTHPDAITCAPPPEVVVPENIETWVLPMAVGHLEIAGQGSHAGELGWLKPDGTASYAGGPVNIDPVTDAPMGGYLRFKMLHSLDLPKPGMTRYVWSWRPKPEPDPRVHGEFYDPGLPAGHPANAHAWVRMDDPVVRHYQVPGPGGFPKFPVVALGPDADELFAFREATPPAGVWPVSGFWEDQWSAKLDSTAMDPGLYQVRVTVHDEAGNIVAPSTGTFEFVVTDTRVGAETYETRGVLPGSGTPADPGEVIDNGFVFDLRIDNAPCEAVLFAPQAGGGAVADPCGFLRYGDPSTDVTLSFTARQEHGNGWFLLELVRGLSGVAQVEVMDGARVDATSVPVDTNGGPDWTNAFYSGDGDGHFTGTFPAERFLETCDNGAFAVRLYVRAKAHDGLDRLREYDRAALMGFALAEELPED